MKYRVFGRTGWQVSEIGFGAWQIGGDWGAVDDQQSIDTLLYAYEQGVNFVDTAELYGKGHSETVIGRSLKEWKDGKVYVATKAQPIVWPSPDEAKPDMRGRYPRWHLRENVEASLDRSVIVNRTILKNDDPKKFAGQLTENTIRMLREGVMTLTIDQNPERQARNAVNLILGQFGYSESAADPQTREYVPFTIYTRENLPTNKGQASDGGSPLSHK